MTPAQALVVERAAADHGMTLLLNPGEPPNWLDRFEGHVPRVNVLRVDGTVSRAWEWLDAVDWRDVVAVRAEWPTGQPIFVDALEAEDDEDELY